MKNEAIKKEQIIMRLIRIMTAIVLCIYVLRLLKDRNEIYILHDEFAYWAMAAKYSGYSWKGMMTDSSYYSMGYSLLLVPLFYMKTEAAIMYKLAIVLNSIFIIMSYFISCAVARDLFSDFKDIEITIVCGIVSLYPYITTQSNYAWPEIFLYFSFWLEVFLLCKFAKTIKLKWGFLAIIEGIWMFFIHQRTIGVLAVCILVIVCIIFRNRACYRTVISKKNLLLCIIMLGMILGFTALFILLKQYNLNHIFTQNEIVQMNDFSGQIFKIKSMFSIKGIINIFHSFIGKYYYFCVSTILIGPYAFLILVKKNITDFLLSKSLEWQWFINLFFLLAFGAMISIASIFMMGDYTAKEIKIRIDQVFYGRYFEFTLGPLLMTGLHSLKKVKAEYKIYFSVIFLFIATTLATHNIVKKVHSINKIDLSAPAFNYFFWSTNNYEGAILHGAILVCFLFMIVGILIYCKQIEKLRYWIAIIVIGLMWVKETSINDDIIKFREKENNAYIYNTVAFLENLENIDKLAYVYSDEDSNLYYRYAFYIQYHLYQMDMQKIKCHDLKDLTPTNSVIYIVMEDSTLKEEFLRTYELLYNNECIYLFRLKEDS